MFKKDKDSLDDLIAMLACMNFDMSVRTDGKDEWTLKFTKVPR